MQLIVKCAKHETELIAQIVEIAGDRIVIRVEFCVACFGDAYQSGLQSRDIAEEETHMLENANNGPEEDEDEDEDLETEEELDDLDDEDDPDEIEPDDGDDDDDLDIEDDSDDPRI